MKIFRLIYLFFILNSSHFIGAQVLQRVSGFIKDSASGEVLICANIFDIATQKGTSADHNGYFTMMLHLPAEIEITFVGYHAKKLLITHSMENLASIHLVKEEQLSEVIVYSNYNKDPNRLSLTVKEIMQIPAIGGRPDVGRGLQLLPGIASMKEGSSILLVRGGDFGQNLYLFDQTPIIYVNHLGGFFSVFNSDIIHHIDVYKGNFPAKFGGKLSSVVDIVQKEGDNSKLKGSFGIGLTEMSLFLEGPTKLKNSSIVFAGRKTLIDPIMLLASKIADGNLISYGFHDLNMKYTWKPNLNNTLFFNAYYGDDYLNYWSKKSNTSVDGQHSGYYWGNQMFSLNYKYIINRNLYGSNVLSFSRYRVLKKHEFTIRETSVSEKSSNVSSIEDVTIQSALKYQMTSNWLLEGGVMSSFQFFIPSKITSSSINYDNADATKITEMSFFASNRIKFLKYSLMDIGIRTTLCPECNVRKIYFDPRLNIKIGLNSSHRFSFNYASMHQFSHLLYTSGSIVQNEIWVPSVNGINPAVSKLYSISWESMFLSNKYSIELSAYDKKMFGLVNFKEGYSNVTGYNNWQSKIETDGTGVANGIECMIKKNVGKLSGFIGYTFSTNYRRFSNINQGKKFVFDYDRPHNLTCFTSIALTKKTRLSFNWIFQTGLPYTPAIGKFFIPNLDSENSNELVEGLLYGEKNSVRMRDYHRLDIALEYERITKKKRKSVWSFSIYNVYNRMNPYAYYYNTKDGSEIVMPEFGQKVLPLKLYQVSYFPILPSVSYKIYFDKLSLKDIQSKKIFRKLLFHE